MKNNLTHQDYRNLNAAGRVWGRSVTLPAADENIPAIQEGPEALALGVDYWLMSTNDRERTAVVYEFHEGARQFQNISEENILSTFTLIASARKINSVRSTNHG